MSERLRSWVRSLDDQDMRHEVISKLQDFHIISRSGLLIDGDWEDRSSGHCGKSESWPWMTVLPRSPKTGEQAVTGTGSKILTKCWKHWQSLVGLILYLVFLQQSTPAVWLNCARLENSILSSTGSHKSPSAEGGAEMHLIGKEGSELVRTQLSLLHAASRYSIK